MNHLRHVWLLLATIGTELLVIVKYSQGQFPTPIPTVVKRLWTIGGFGLVLYPIVKVSRSRPPQDLTKEGLDAHDIFPSTT
jgi:hypothetical protein